MPDDPSLTYQPNGTSAPRRNLAFKLQESYSIKDWGATGLNSVGDKVKIQAASDEMAYGGTLFISPGQYKFAAGGLLQNRDHSWDLDPEGLIRGDYTIGQTTDLLSVSITDTNGQSEYRQRGIVGGRFLCNNTQYAPPVENLFAAGGYAIKISTVSPGIPIIGYTIDRASISGGTGAIHFLGSVPIPLAWTMISNSTIENGVLCEDTADGMFFFNNISDGVKTAYKIDSLLGAFCNTIWGGSTGNREGALDVINGSLVRMINLQCEHGATFAGASAAAFSVRLQGVDFPCFLAVVEKCNFGAGLGRVSNTVIIQNSQGTVIDENYFFLSDVADVRIESLARHSVVGTRNMARGTRSAKATLATNEYTDASRRLTITMPSNAGARAKGTRGVWHPAADILTSFQNTWAINGMEIMLGETGMVVFNGGLNNGTTTGNICTFPDWLRPHQDAYIHISITSTGAVQSLKIAASTGVLSVVGTLAAAGINFANATYPAMLNNPYNAGP